MAQDLKSAAAEIKRAIALPTNPVGIKLVSNARELLEVPGVRPLASTAPCHMAAIARYGRSDAVVGASAQATKCLWGAACLGLVRTPGRLAEGDLYLPFTEGEEAARNLHRGLTVMGEEGAVRAGVIMGPLDLMPVAPDAVVLYLRPAQALRLIIAFAFRDGEPVRSVMTGQASLCSAVARAVRDGQVTVDIPCIGDRTYGLVQDDELLMAFPAERLSQLIEGLRGSEPAAAYPYAPFLRWSPLFPPAFEPHRGELDG